MANVYAKFLKLVGKGCDLVIALSHCGTAEDKSSIAAASEGIWM